MRYIKLFESHDKQYVKISYDEYITLSDDKSRESFIKSEIDAILKFVPYRFSDEKWKLDRRYIDTHKVYISFGEFGLFIDKCSDSWYLLQYTSDEIDYVFYKCDEFIGLKNCLEYLKLN